MKEQTAKPGKENKSCPAKGRRYSPGERDKILAYAKSHNVLASVEQFNVAPTTIYEWRRALKRRASAMDKIAPGSTVEKEFKSSQESRDGKILAMWRRHPGYGPSQIRNMLKRNGFKVSVGTVRHVMEENGYLPPKFKRKEHVGRYEANRPRELYHLDFFHFYVHKQKQCVLFIEDDYSRFIAGWAMVPTEKADDVIVCFEESVQRYGRPEGVMTDRGSAFHSWKGLSRFEALLESYEINYYLAKEAAVNGKVEALNASCQKECIEQNEFMDLTDAARSIKRWVDHYNHYRTHHGLGGLLVPADRYYGLTEQTMKRIEQGLGAHSLDVVNPDNRGLDLFRIASNGGKPQIWLMGEKILG